METALTDGAINLLNYGVLGIMCIVFLSAIVYLVKQFKDSVKIIIEDKDSQIKNWQEASEKKDQQLDTALLNITNNTARLTDLYEGLNNAIEKTPDRTVDKIMLAQSKK